MHQLVLPLTARRRPRGAFNLYSLFTSQLPWFRWLDIASSGRCWLLPPLSSVPREVSPRLVEWIAVWVRVRGCASSMYVKWCWVCGSDMAFGIWVEDTRDQGLAWKKKSKQGGSDLFATTVKTHLFMHSSLHCYATFHTMDHSILHNLMVCLYGALWGYLSRRNAKKSDDATAVKCCM